MNREERRDAEHRLAGELHRLKETEAPEDLTLAVLLLAATTRVRDFCPHARRGLLLLDVPATVDLTDRWAACQDCLPDNASGDLCPDQPDDGLCDVCDEAPDLRAPMTLWTGSLTWELRLGACCADKFGVVSP